MWWLWWTQRIKIIGSHLGRFHFKGLCSDVVSNTSNIGWDWPGLALARATSLQSFVLQSIFKSTFSFSGPIWPKLTLVHTGWRVSILPKGAWIHSLGVWCWCLVGKRVGRVISQNKKNRGLSERLPSLASTSVRPWSAGNLSGWELPEQIINELTD